MEKLLKIKVSPKNYLYGKLHGSPKQPLFIVVHGLPSYMDEELHHNAVKYFAKHGFATFRFNLYDWRPKARQLIDCTLRIHADDIDTIVRYFRKLGYKKIFIAGHSFGGPSILSSREQKFDAVALWDPSYEISFIKKEYGLRGGGYLKEVDGYLMPWGFSTVVGGQMAREVDKIKWNSLTPNFKPPFLVALAGDGVLVKKAGQYFKHGVSKKKLLIIKGATHSFNDSEAVERSLFSNTLRWFRKFM